MQYRLGELAERLGLALEGDADTLVDGISTLANSRRGSLSFLANPRYRKHLLQTRAAAVILAADEHEHCPVAALISSNPYLDYARASALFAPVQPTGAFIHPSAVVHPDAVLGEEVQIAANVVIDSGVVLGDRVQIGAGSVLGQGCRLGAESRLMPQVVVYHDCLIGARVLIHSGAVIGSDGFGFANDQGRWIKIHQLGRVVIGDDVEIGANTSIDRGAIEDTVIGNGVILDNQIQIAHNVSIGDHTAMAGCVGVAGSAQIGKHCAIGGGAGILGHLQIVDGTTVTAMSLVTGNIRQPGVYASGTPLDRKESWQKNAVRFKQLDELTRRIKVLERQLSQRSERGEGDA